MSKKKSKQPIAKRSGAPQISEKNSVVLNFAYNLYSATKDSKSAKATKELLLYKRKNFPGESLSGGVKQLLKYRKLLLDNESVFENLVYILMKANEDEAVKDKVIEIIMSNFCRDIDFCLASTQRQNGFEAMRGRDGIEGFINYMSEPDPMAEEFFLLLSTGWLYLSRYLEFTDSWDIAENKILNGCSGRPQSPAATARALAMIEEINGRVEAFDATDQQLTDEYRNSTDFYKDVTDEFLLFISGMNGPSQKRDCARLEYDYSLSLKNVYAIHAHKRTKAMKKMQADKVLASQLPAKTVNINEYESPLHLWISEALNSIRCEYLLSGIDIITIAAKCPLSLRDGRNMVKKAFLFHDMEYRATHNDGAVCDYSNEPEMIAVCRTLVRIWGETLISNRIDAFLSNSGPADAKIKNELSEATALIGKLKKEIEQLETKHESGESKDNAELKKKTEEIKANRTELHDTKSALAKETARTEELEQKNKELRMLLNSSMTGEEETEAVAEDSGVDEEFFAEYIKNNKVLIWGLRASTEKKYAEIYPELSFASSDRRLTRQQLESYEVFIMCTSNTNHANYYAARDTAKAIGIKMAYLAKTMNDPKHLWWALGIALRGEAKEEEAN